MPFPSFSATRTEPCAQSHPTTRPYVTRPHVRLSVAVWTRSSSTTAAAHDEYYEQHSVGEVVSGHLADGQVRLSPATLDFSRKGHDAMPDAFNQRPVTTVTPLVLDSPSAELRAGGASEHKCQKVHRLLSASFNRAVRYGWLAANPCLQATKPKVTTREIEPPTPEQVRALIVEAAEVNEDLVVCLRVAAATGVRRGELVALTWSDFVGERLTIRRSVVESDGVLIERRTMVCRPTNS